MTITNTGNESDRLIGGSTDIARYFEVLEMSMEIGVRKMRSMLNGLEIKLGARTFWLSQRAYRQTKQLV